MDIVFVLRLVCTLLHTGSTTLLQDRIVSFLHVCFGKVNITTDFSQISCDILKKRKQHHRLPESLLKFLKTENELFIIYSMFSFYLVNEMLFKS